jgi:hypothetical protein
MNSNSEEGRANWERIRSRGKPLFIGLFAAIHTVVTLLLYGLITFLFPEADILSWIWAFLTGLFGGALNGFIVWRLAQRHNP